MASLRKLTRREMDVMKLMVPGRRNKEIADRLVITVGVVEGHVTNILRKLGATSRTEAVYMAVTCEKEETHA